MAIDNYMRGNLLQETKLDFENVKITQIVVSNAASHLKYYTPTQVLISLKYLKAKLWIWISHNNLKFSEHKIICTWEKSQMTHKQTVRSRILTAQLLFPTISSCHKRNGIISHIPYSSKGSINQLKYNGIVPKTFVLWMLLFTTPMYTQI